MTHYPTDAKCRESVAAAEADRASNAKVIVEQGHIIVEKGLANTKLLKEVHENQKETCVHLEVQTKALDALHARADQAVGSLGQSQITLDEQRGIIEGIRVDIGDIKCKISDDNVEIRSSSLEESSELEKPTLILGALSKVLSFVLSGTMIISAQALAAQARELSRNSTKLVPDRTEMGILPPVGSKQPHEQVELHPATAQEDYRLSVAEFHSDANQQ